MAAQLDALGSGIIPAGAILVDAPVVLHLADGGAAAAPELGLPLLGAMDDLRAMHARYRFRLAIVTLPGAMEEEAVSVHGALGALKIAARVIAPFAEQLAVEPDEASPPGATSPSPPHPSAGLSTWRAPATIDLAALIGRRPYDLDAAAVGEMLGGRRILITGAGGSIGSHIAHVAAQFGPEQLILMDRSENALFEIDRQLSRRYPNVARRAMLHDVVDAEQTLRHLVAVRPHVVFHAAAHKHVPLMEDHPAHAVTNNLFGTKSIADAAVATGAERFVMISSDKAVHPTSVMGATKRLAELYVHSLAGAPTRTGMVRFGNVLGSACSVLTIWSTQIGEGGPITITDPRMTRYFMTIPEAATLVIQSSTLTERPSGCVFVLDMGEPINILELASRFARAHGIEPRILWESADALPPELPDGTTAAAGGPTIDIIFTGSRPGEKIHEKLAYDTELLEKTSHPGINAWGGKWANADGPAVTTMIADLSAVRTSSDHRGVLSTIRRYVPELNQT